MPRPVPTHDVERQLFAGGARIVAGIDEVGRGAIAGPVTVGAVAVDASHTTFPEGLADSKLLTPRRREAMDPLVRSWALAHATGSATAAEIDRIGIVSALGLAASRALHALGAVPDVLIVDGNTPFLVEEPGGPRILMRVKADQDCACVAAASVIAKVERDAVMTALHASHPHYGWDGNKGYGAAVHTAAIRAHGVTEHHRTSWNLGLPA
ncbi:MAG: ribonuclease HII [Actinomycetes bacterium]